MGGLCDIRAVCVGNFQGADMTHPTVTKKDVAIRLGFLALLIVVACLIGGSGFALAVVLCNAPVFYWFITFNDDAIDREYRKGSTDG